MRKLLTAILLTLLSCLLFSCGTIEDTKQSFSGYLPAIQKLLDTEKRFKTALDDFTTHSSATAAMDNLDTLRNSVQAVINHSSDLRAGLRYLVLAKDARESGLANLTAALERRRPCFQGK